MKILIDMNFSIRWVEALNDAGIEAIHWSSVGRHSAPDIEILRYAQVHDFTIMTNDLDFSALLAFNRAAKPSVIQIRVKDAKPENLAETIVKCLEEWSEEIKSGAVISIDVDRARVHILPLV